MLYKMNINALLRINPIRDEIPPLLGFYAKFFVISSLMSSTTTFSIAI